MSADSTDTAKMDARPLLGELPTVSGGEPTDEDIAAGSEAQAVLMEEQERQYAKTPLIRRILEEFKQLIVFVVPSAPLPCLWHVLTVSPSCRLALPICCTYFLDSGMSLINTAFLGHIGARELAAGNLALVLTNTLGFVPSLPVLSVAAHPPFFFTLHTIAPRWLPDGRLATAC